MIVIWLEKSSSKSSSQSVLEKEVPRKSCEGWKWKKMFPHHLRVKECCLIAIYFTLSLCAWGCPSSLPLGTINLNQKTNIAEWMCKLYPILLYKIINGIKSQNIKRSTYRKKRKRHVRRAQSAAEFDSQAVFTANKRHLFRWMPF